jgi:hypothetical protein
LSHKPNVADLASVGALLAAGAAVPVIGKRHTVDGFPQAMRHPTEGSHHEKVVILMPQKN